MCNLAKPHENTACFDCTHGCDSLRLPFCFSCGSILVLPLRMETLQSVLKILLVYLEGTRKLSAEIRGPSCFVVVQLRRGTTKDAFKQLRPVRTESTTAERPRTPAFCSETYTKCMRRNQRHSEAAQMTVCVTLISTLRAIIPLQFYFEGGFLNDICPSDVFFHMQMQSQ